jgi:hypothetical protein
MSEIPTIEIDMEAKATVKAVGSTSDFWIENEMSMPTNPIAVRVMPDNFCRPA